MKWILIIISFFTANFAFTINAALASQELKVTLQPSVISLDPGGVQDSQSLFVSRQVNCQLVRNQGPTFVLDAAESIKYINPLTIVLKISKEAKFHDGTPVTANDVIASFNYIKESRNIFKNFFTWINTIQSTDDRTIVFSLQKHIPQFLKALSSMNFTIFKKSFLVKAKKNTTLWKQPLGCGGYRIVEFNNEKIKLFPISNGLPITFYLTKKNQIEANDIEKYDIVTLNVIGTSEDLNNFDKLEMLDPLQYFVGINSKSNLWKNKCERCQFLATLNTKDLLTSYGRIAIEANDLLPKGTLGYRADSNYTGDMASSVKNTINYKLNDKIRPLCLAYLTVSIQQNNKDAFSNMFKKNYSKIIIKPITNVKKFGKTFLSENCDVLLFALKSHYFDGYEYLTIFENNDANFSGMYNKILDAHILKSQIIENVNDRAKEYQKIIKEIRDLCVIRPLFTIPNRIIYLRKGLNAPEIGLVSIHQYYLGNISR